MKTGKQRMHSMLLSAPNIITASRGVAAVLLLFLGYGSALFWAIYAWCGVSDMIDGPLARRMNVTSRRGAVLDSVADVIFVVFAAIAILPNFLITKWMWICICIVAVTRIINIASAVVCHKRVVMLHTSANKLTGLLLFVLPAVALWVPFQIAGGVVIAVAMFAAVQEGHFIRTGRIY